MIEKKDDYLLSHIKDICLKNFAPKYFDFYDEARQDIIEDTIKNYGVPYLFFGGYSGTQRKMLCIYPEYCFSDELEWPIMGISFKKVEGLSHRNVLGKLMTMGITRESIGDIDIGDEWVQIIFNKRLKDFFWINFNEIKGNKIEPYFIETTKITAFEKKFKRVSIVIVSDRVDGIINKIWGFSRQQSIKYIKQGRLFINYMEIVKNDYRVNLGDIISLRGKGKVVIISMDHRTKKGKIRMEIDKYD